LLPQKPLTLPRTPSFSSLVNKKVRRTSSSETLSADENPDRQEINTAKKVAQSMDTGRKNKLFICQKCKKILHSQEDLAKHIKDDHKSKDTQTGAKRKKLQTMSVKGKRSKAHAKEGADNGEFILPD
jgi:RNase P subunit RPR2